MIEVDRLTKDFGTVVAVRDVSFSVSKGEIVGFLGPNGAGKSTTLRIIAGFLGATSGKVSVNGHDIAESSLAARKSLGYMPEAAPLYPELRVVEYLGFRAELKGVPRRERKKAVERALELSGSKDMAAVVIGHLSKGYRQRVALADALVNSPPLLILDEPTAGLDPNQILEVRKLVRELGREHTILLSTHILSEVEAVCERALVIARGKLVTEGTLEELRRLRHGAGISLLVRGTGEAITAALASVGAVEIEAGEDGLCRVTLELEQQADLGKAVEDAVAALALAGLGVRAVERKGRSLEEVFAEVTTAPEPAP
ncbi:MAG TPA: ATP-binding cassette domain-containing protein [Polyangiaceae bacterium]|nr:ATP-binding cassette domain-containing protein [Polyangiaceae bacterium]